MAKGHKGKSETVECAGRTAARGTTVYIKDAPAGAIYATFLYKVLRAGCSVSVGSSDDPTLTIGQGKRSKSKAGESKASTPRLSNSPGQSQQPSSQQENG